MLRCLGFVAIVAACGDGVRVDADASVPVDGTAQLVRIRVTDGVGGLPVYFQYEDSSIALVTETDEAGRASAYMSRPGFVTVVGPSQQITTYAGVEPGDDIVNGQPVTFPAQQVPINVKVTSLPAPRAKVSTRCGESTAIAMPTTVVLWLHPCADTVDAVLFAGDADELNNLFPPRFYQYVRDVPVVELSTLTFGDTFEREAPGAVTVAGLPEGTLQARVAQSFIADRHLFARAEEWKPTGAGTTRVELDLTPIPRSPHVIVQTAVEAWSADGLSTPRLIEWGPGSTELSVDLEPQPRAYTELPRFVPEANAVVWTEEPSGDIANVAIARLRWFTNDTSPTWTIVSPRGAEPFVRLPVLPDPALRPFPPTTSVDGLETIVYAGGYRAFRDLGDLDLGGVFPALTPAGRIAYRSLRQ